MNSGISSFGTAIAGALLLAVVAWPAQDAAAGKPAAKAPAAKAPAVKAQPPEQQAPGKPAAAKPQNAPTTKPQPKPAGKQPAKPAAEPAPEPAAEAPAQPAADGQPTPLSDTDSIMAARFAKVSTTTEAHAWLAGFVGKWKMVSKLTLMPDRAPVESTGTSEFRMLMDGRFLVENQDANGGAGPFKGMGVVGFNSLTGKAERVWFDTTSTAMVKSEGELSTERGEIRWADTWTDPLAGEVRTVTSVLHKVSDTEFTFQQSNEFRGQTFKSLVLQYRKD